MQSSLSDAGTNAGIERQLGEVVGTLRATVQGLDHVRQSLERLGERAAFKGDLEALRTELTNSLAAEKRKIEELRSFMIATSIKLSMAAAFLALVIPLILRAIPFHRLFGG